MASELGRLPECWFPLNCKRASCLQFKISVGIPPPIMFPLRARTLRDAARDYVLQREVTSRLPLRLSE